MAPERDVRFRARTVLLVIALVVAAIVLLELLLIARQVVTWFLIALFFALALSPAVDWMQRRGVRRRGLAIGVTYLGVFGAFTGIGFLFIPTLVDQVNEFAKAVPDYIDDLTEGRGKLGFLQEKYHLADKVREALREGGAAKVLGFSGAALAITKSIITIVVATITIIFMTFFMLLEGPVWMERFFGLLSPESQPRWRNVARDIHKAVGGYVTGNLLISLIAGVLSTVALLVLGVQYAVALGLLVAILDLIPLAGATIAAILVSTVTFLDRGLVPGIAIVVFFVVYQQLENHFLQPIIYGRTVQLSPLAVLVAVLFGASLAGILGALAAIPVAGTIQVLIVDYLRHRRERILDPPTAAVELPPGAG